MSGMDDWKQKELNVEELSIKVALCFVLMAPFLTERSCCVIDDTMGYNLTFKVLEGHPIYLLILLDIP